jgi:hypothetical protein
MWYHTHSLLQDELNDKNRYFCVIRTSSLTELSLPWEAANCADTQEFPSILWNQKIHYRVHNAPSTSSYPEADQSNPYHPMDINKLKVQTCSVI